MNCKILLAEMCDKNPKWKMMAVTMWMTGGAKMGGHWPFQIFHSEDGIKQFFMDLAILECNRA